ncbi:MAG: xylose isomerase [Bacteroidetes bacterium]|nr:MAG: xylose isomerase [Bacteroidota bacterium]
MTTRRSFIKKTALALAGTSVLSNELFAARKKNEVLGIQLYSVRDEMTKDPKGTLKAIAEIGYKYVEHANYVNRKFYGFTPAEFKKILGDLGLQMPSGHTTMSTNAWDAAKNDFTESWIHTVEDAATMGQKYVISPWLDDAYRKNYDDLKKYMEVFNKSGELCRKHGMKFGYHNHDFEFTTTLNGQKVFDIILQNTDPNLVAQQLDIGNMYGAGGRALDIINQYPGKFELMHVKDEIKSAKGEMGGYESTILGKGVVGTKDVVDLARKKGGTSYFIIEQESYQGKAPIDCAKEDFDIMKKWGF